MDGNNLENNVNVEETVREAAVTSEPVSEVPVMPKEPVVEAPVTSTEPVYTAPVGTVPPMPSNIVNEDYIKNYNKSLKKRTQLEVKVGAGILSIVGALFLMAALYFGSMYLDKYWMVIAMFAAGGLIVLVSELLIERRLKFFGKIITGLGFGILYYAGIFAYLSIKLYDFYITLAVLGGIALLNFLIARLRKSPFLEIVCSIGSVVPLVVYDANIDNMTFAYLMGFALAVNFILFIMPYKKGFGASKIIRLFVVFGALIYANYMYYWLVDYTWFGFAVVLSVFVMFTCYLFNTKDICVETFALILIGISSVMISDTIDWYVLAGYAAVCVFMFLCLIAKKQRWAPISVLLLFALLFVYVTSGASPVVSVYLNADFATLIVLSVLVISKLCAFSKDFALTDAVVSLFALLAGVFFKDNYLAFVIMFVGFLGVLMCSRFKLYHEFLYTIMMSLFLWYHGFSYLTVPIIMATWFVLVVLFNLIPAMRVKGILVYNIFYLIANTCLILWVPMLRYRGLDEIIVVSSVAFISILICLCVFRSKFKLNTKARYIIMAAVLTYLGFFMKIDPLWISISLMAVAFVTIAIGCIANRFEARIYGLVLSLAVCVKVAWIDYADESNFNRMIVFLVVGLIAIAISFVYLILESREQKQLKALKEKERLAAMGMAVPQAAAAGVSPVVNPYMAVAENAGSVAPVMDMLQNAQVNEESSQSNESLSEMVYNVESVGESSEESSDDTSGEMPVETSNDAAVEATEETVFETSDAGEEPAATESEEK